MSTKNMRRFVAILDTGAGSSFIRQDELPQHMQKNIEPLQQQVDIKNATGKPLPIAGTLRLSVQIGSKMEEVQLLVAEELETAIILGCDYCDEHVECIKPRRRIIGMDDGSMTPIVRRASRSQVEALLPEEQVDEERRKRISPKIKVTKFTRLPPGSQTFVTVRTQRGRMITVEPQQQLYEKLGCRTASGVANVRPGQPFRILIANFLSLIHI